MTLRIAHLEIEAPVFLAPLAGVSDAPFRLLCREQGAAWVCSELVSSDGLIRGSQKTLDFLYFFPEERPVGVQLFGSDPAVMAEAARYVSSRPPDLRPDFIDLNIGCPVHKVVTREAGAALLCNLPLLGSMVRAVVEASSLPVTAKTRCGWDNDHRNGVEVAQLLEQSGVAMVAMHARTRAQKFEGKADWSVITEAKQKVSIPLVGNGDVVSAAEAKRMLEETGCDAVMIGRGAFGNPWIFRETRALLEGRATPPAPTPRERLAALLRQYRLSLALADERHASLEIRKHVAWYVKGLPNAAPFKERGQKIETASALEDLVREYVAELEGRGLADVPGGLPPRAAAAAAAGNGNGADKDPNDAYMADDGSAEAASLAAQGELIAMARTPAQRLIHGMTRGKIALDAAVDSLLVAAQDGLADATLDHDRARRCGYPEVVFGQGKTPDQIAAIATRLFESAGRVLITRADERAQEHLRARFPRAHVNARARIVRLGPAPRARGRVAVVAAGTADLPVAEEAIETLTALGSRVDRIADVGVAGLHRLVARTPLLRRARVAVVVAGMEGALPSVVQGLLERPVVAVPTSVGYGAHFRGLAPLLAMLNSCAPGITVVNIDNGFGAGYAAHLINVTGLPRTNGHVPVRAKSRR